MQKNDRLAKRELRQQEQLRLEQLRAERGVLSEDALALKHISKKLLDEDVGLYKTKWFDYRFTNPIEATQQFTRIYLESFKKLKVVNFHHQADEFNYNGWDDLFSAENIVRQRTNCFWRCRQIADGLGMPYEQYTWFAIESYLRRSNGRMPSIRSIYSDRVVLDVYNKWNEMRQARLFYSELDQYKSENYCGNINQLAHIDWLFENISSRANADYLFRDFIERKRLIPISIANEKLGAQRVRVISSIS